MVIGKYKMIQKRNETLKSNSVLKLKVDIQEQEELV